MKVSSSKENILKKIRKALTQSTPLPFPQSEGNNSVYQPASQDPEIEFAEQFSKLQGKFVYAQDHAELVIQLTALAAQRKWSKIYCREDKLRPILDDCQFTDAAKLDLATCDAAITTCELLIARTGSIVMSSAGPSGRTVSVYAPIHICIAYADQLVYDLKDGLVALKEKYQQNLPSLITFATGPSRTADIEKTLVVGVHGPKEVFVFLVDRQ